MDNCKLKFAGMTNILVRQLARSRAIELQQREEIFVKSKPGSKIPIASNSFFRAVKFGVSTDLEGLEANP